MNQSDGQQNHDYETIADFVRRSSGLAVENRLNPKTGTEELRIHQNVDGRWIAFEAKSVDEVLSRQDSDGKDFLQVNFVDGRKILITEKLVGFKPAETPGLDLRKLPKVVTTPDLVSVLEAIDDSVTGYGQKSEEVEVLRRVFDSVLKGAIAVGFELSTEKAWLTAITAVKSKHVA